MKKIMIFMTLLFNTTIYAGWDCTGDSIELKIRDMQYPTTVTVRVNGNMVYESIAVVARFASGASTYESPSFSVPSRLYATIYGDSSDIRGSITEISYGPIFQHGRDLEFKQINQ